MKKLLIFLLYFISVAVYAEDCPIPRDEYGDKIDLTCGGTSYKVHLSFDDGPAGKKTKNILDILREENLEATFFVNTSNITDYEILKQMKGESEIYVGKE